MSSSNYSSYPPKSAPSPYSIQSTYISAPPIPSIIIPQNISDIIPSFVLNILLNYDQPTINRISNLITMIDNIVDLSGNTYRSVRTQNSQTYGILLTQLLVFILFIHLKEPFVSQLIQVVGSIPQLQMDLINVLYNFRSNEPIITFYTTVLNNIHTFPMNSTQFIPMLTTIANNIINPPTIPAQPNATNTNANTRTLENVNRNLTYLTSLGLTPESDNETMKKTVKRYKNLTGTNYSPPQSDVSREDLEKDLQYLFGLGLTADSGNETLNDRLSKWKTLTGEDYVYSASGGRRRKMRKIKTSKRKQRKVRKSRK